MRWEALFRDLEAQLEGEADEAWRQEVAERTRGERMASTVAARLAASRGLPVVLTAADGSRMRGTVRESGSDWALLDDAGRERLVPTARLAALDGLARRADILSEVEARLTMSRTLRALSRDRAHVRIRAGVEWTGVIAAVAADHLDLTVDGGADVCVPLAAIVEVVSA